MTRFDSVAVIVLALAATTAGCQLGRAKGPVSPSLVISRQYSQQGVTAMEHGQWDAAEATLAKAVAACPADAEARRNYAEILWQIGRHSDAVAQLDEASRLSPEDAVLHTRIAEMRLALGENEAALAQAEQALNLDPRLSRAWTAHGRILRAAGQPRPALADYHRALGYAPDDRETLLETAATYRQVEEPQRALVVLQSLCDTYTPGEEPTPVLTLLAEIYGQVGRYQDSAGVLAVVLQRGPATPEVLFSMAQCQSQLGHRSEALAAARQAVALNPQHEPSLQLLQRLELAERPAGLPPR